MGEHRTEKLDVHEAKFDDQVIKLKKCIDDDEEMKDIKPLRISKNHSNLKPCQLCNWKGSATCERIGNAEVLQRVERHIVNWSFRLVIHHSYQSDLTPRVRPVYSSRPFIDDKVMSAAAIAEGKRILRWSRVEGWKTKHSGHWCLSCWGWRICHIAARQSRRWMKPVPISQLFCQRRSPTNQRYIYDDGYW